MSVILNMYFIMPVDKSTKLKTPSINYTQLMLNKNNSNSSLETAPPTQYARVVVVQNEGGMKGVDERG